MTSRLKGGLSESKKGALILLGLLLFFISGIRMIQFESAPNPVSYSEIEFHQRLLDSLSASPLSDSFDTFKYNPNYLSDYRAYQLGIAVDAYDKLTHHRSQGEYINTLSEFQEITGVSDSLLEELQSVFRFPKMKTQTPVKRFESKKDLNTADAVSLQKVRGVGPVLAARIVKYRSLLSGFSVPEQCYEVYGLDSLVVKRLLKIFEIQSPPQITLQSLAEVSLVELIKIPYLNRSEAQRIIALRTEKGQISMSILSELFPESPNKIARLKLYLY